jgi:hypothetical protein
MATKGVVIGHIPSNEEFGDHSIGYYTVKLDDGSFVTVEHTSPYYNRTGGFLALPNKGDRVLIDKLSDTADKGTWYYLATIATPGAGKILEKGDVEPQPQLLNSVIGKLGVPQKVILQSPKGNSLILSDDYNESESNVGVFLKTGAGKYFKLSDDKKQNSIVLKTELGPEEEIASISLQGNPVEGSTRQSFSVTIIANNTVELRSLKGDIDLNIVDGKEINIINKSSGANGDHLVLPNGTTIIDPTPGNINIQSTRGDINIVAGPTLEEVILAQSVYAQRRAEWQVASQAAIALGQVPPPEPQLPIFNPIIKLKAQDPLTGGIGAAIDIESDGVVNIRGKLGVNIDTLTPVPNPVNQDGDPLNNVPDVGVLTGNVTIAGRRIDLN